MEQITVKMFVNTCDYMAHLLEEIMTSSTEIPKDTFISLNDLMAKLLSFMSHLYKHNSHENLPAQTRITTDVSKSMPIHPQAPTSTFNPAMAQPHQYGKPMPQVLAGYRLYQMPPAMNIPFNQLSSSQVNFNNNNRNIPSLFQNHYQPFHQQAPVLATNNPPNIAFSRTTKTPTINPFSSIGTASFSTLNTSTQSNTQSSVMPPQPINIPPTNDSTQLNNQPKKCEVPITELFAMLLTSLSNGITSDLNVRFYCQLCDLICSPWSSHTNDVVHKERCNGLKKLKMKSCRLCGIYLYGKKTEIVQYFKYHFEKIHLDEQLTNWEEALISVDSAEVLVKELQFDKDSSISKSSSTADSDKPKRKRRKNKNSGIPNSTGQNPDSLEEIKTANEAGSAIPTIENNTFPANDNKVQLMVKSASGEVSTHTDVVSIISDTVSTHNDTISTHTETKSTHTGTLSPNTDAILTNTDADAVLTNTDTVLTNNDAILTNNDAISTDTDAISTDTDTVLNNTGEVLTNTDAVLTNTDAVLTNTDAVLTQTDEVSTHTDKIIALPAKNHENTPTSDSSPYHQFDLLIKVMAEEWNKSSILMDVGFCDVCQVGIKSAFDWFSHTSDHKSTGDASWKEEICPKCQVKIFGLDHQKYFSLISHCKLDEMIG